MGDENPIRTIGDYSKPSYEGYRKTIELLVGNNVTVDYAVRDWLSKMSAEKAWTTIEELARYKEEGWHDSVAAGERGLNYENPDIEQLLGIMEIKVDALMNDAISLMGRSESVFGMTSTNNKRNVKSRYDMKNSSPQSTPQVLLSFEENTSPVTYPDEVEKTIRLPIEVEHLDETPLEDLGLNTCNHDTPFSSREIPSFDELEPQPQPFPSFPSLEVYHLTIHTPPSPHVASFHPKYTYCYYHPCIDDPKKHYEFKPGLLGQSRSLGVDFSNMKMIEDDWKLEPKEVSFLGRGLKSPLRPKKVENARIKETHHLEQINQRPIFQHMAPSNHNGMYRYYHPYLNSSVGEPSPLSVK
ncbi:hypothetical protein Tco_0146083 [Tanacetum coccineum]